MNLIIQPDAGIGPVVTAIKQAKKTVDVLIFRLDLQEITRSLEAAVARGVVVRALIAHTNRGGEKSLRKLEMRLLEKGVTVSRTSDDLVRYHGKMMIVDRRVLHVYGFNFTGLDIAKSRSFGATTKDQKLVQESIKLFEADCARQPYESGHERFIVSPENARERLAAFIKGARKQVLIYDPEVSDPGHAPPPGGAHECGARCPDHRQARRQEVAVELGEISRDGGCTFARSSGTAGARSSAVRAFAGSSSTRVARSASW